MKVYETGFEGLLVIETDLFEDSRGYFFESWNKEKYFNTGIKSDFVQDNISKSKKGTLRGLHYQLPESAQEKLCFVISGNVLDVAVDIRFGSPTFGKYFSMELSGQNKKQIFIPRGFAHGFYVLSDEAVFIYKVNDFYNPKDEKTILYNDKDLAIDWKLSGPVIVSQKDLDGIPFKSIGKDFLFNE